MDRQPSLHYYYLGKRAKRHNFIFYEALPPLTGEIPNMVAVAVQILAKNWKHRKNSQKIKNILISGKELSYSRGCSITRPSISAAHSFVMLKVQSSHILMAMTVPPLERCIKVFKLV